MGTRYTLFQEHPFAGDTTKLFAHYGDTDILPPSEKSVYNLGEVMQHLEILDALLIKHNPDAGKFYYCLFDSHDVEGVRKMARGRIEIVEKKDGLAIDGKFYEMKYVDQFRENSAGSIVLYLFQRSGSWAKVRNALTGKGISFIQSAADGHQCDSGAEVKIDDFLYKNKIEHYRAPSYPQHLELNPGGIRRADWKLADETFVEYWGLEGYSKDYENRIREKRELARLMGINLIELDRTGVEYLCGKFSAYI